MSLTLKDLQRTHPSYDREEMQAHQDLYEGGPRLRGRIQSYVPRHEVEPHGAYRERCARTIYENHVGPLIDGWVGEVFRDPPSFGDTLSDPETAWVSDCDRQGTDLGDFWRERLQEALIHRRAWVLVDLPEAPQGVDLRDRADARSAGLTDPYLVPLAPEQVLDWDLDARGELEWVIWTGQVSRRAGPGAARERVYQWTWYDRQQWIRWEARPGKDGTLSPTEEPRVVAKGVNPHGRVPVVCLDLPPGLWMGRLLREPAVGLLNAQGALDWSLYKSAFSTLVIKRAWETDEHLDMGPGGYLALETDDSADYLEPPGRAYEALARNVEKKTEGLYRVARQISVSVGNDSSRQRSSGLSKEQDRLPTEIVCSVLARLLREAMACSVRLAAALRGEPSTIELGGLEDYEGANVSALLDEAMSLETLRIPSVTFRAAYLSRLVSRVLPGLSAEAREAIRKEIAAGANSALDVEDAYGPGVGA